jgi:uncharacterized protein
MKQTVLITGGSGGIGYELAQLFAGNGYSLVLVARNRDKLEEIKNDFEKRFGIFVKVINKDLSKPSAAKEIFDTLQKESHVIDILVNNAGYGSYGTFAETDLEFQLEMIQLNVVSLVHLTRLLLEPMIQRRSGKILNVASTAAFQPGPFMAVYFASKAFVLSFSEALSNELKGTGVSVTALCPGVTRTDFHKRAGLTDVLPMNNSFAMDAKVVAMDGYRALMRGKAVTISGFRNQVLAFLVRLAPRAIVRKVVRAIQDRKK